MPIGKNMETGNFGDEITGVHSAIKQFVDAQKDGSNWDDGKDSTEKVDKSKKKILKDLVNKSK